MHPLARIGAIATVIATLSVAMAPTAQSIYVSAEATAGCVPHGHDGDIFWVPSTSYAATARGTPADLLGNYKAKGDGFNLANQVDEAQWPLDNEAHVEDDSSDGVVDRVPRGSTPWAESQATAYANLAMPIAASAEASAYCDVPSEEVGMGCGVAMMLLNSDPTSPTYVVFEAVDFVCTVFAEGTY